MQAASTVVPEGLERSTPWFGDPADFERARAVFDSAGYTESAVSQLLTYSIERVPRDAELGGCLWRTRAPTPLCTLVRLFHLNVPVPADAAEGAVAPMELRKWIDAGMLAAADNQIVPRVRVTPFQCLLLVSDRFVNARVEAVPPDFVMGIGGSTRTVANFMVTRPLAKALDMGTGSGVLAFLAARNCQAVCGVDRNERAVRLARFNARLNGMDNVEFVSGDLFEPIDGQQFDLIVGNPPFVVSPAASYLYRDSGMDGDGVSWAIAERAPAHLRDGGICQMLVNFAETGTFDWQQRLSETLRAAGCDGLFLRGKTHSAAEYAALWLESTEFGDPLRLAEKFAVWTDYYARRDIRAIATGCLVIRRRTGANYVRFIEEPDKMIGPGGPFVLDMFGRFDFLGGLPDDASLLRSSFHASPDARLIQECDTLGDGWRPTATRLHLIRGFAFVANSDPLIATLLAQCDGHRPLGILLRDLANTLGLTVEGLLPAALPLVRGLIERGFLLPSNPLAPSGESR